MIRLLSSNRGDWEGEREETHQRSSNCLSGDSPLNVGTTPLYTQQRTQIQCVSYSLLRYVFIAMPPPPPFFLQFGGIR